MSFRLSVISVAAIVVAACAGNPASSQPAATPTLAGTVPPTSAPTPTRSPVVTDAPTASVPPPPTATPFRWPENITAYAAGSAGNELGLLSYLPPSYGADDGVRWPLLVFLHGYSENGAGSEAELRNLIKPDHGIPSLIAAGDWPTRLPFVVIMPQYSYSDAQHCELVDEIQNVITWAELTYRIDPARIYLTGISCGGIGVWDYLASTDENRVAATVPISSAPVWAMQKAGCAIAKTPMWVFHGALDDTVPVQFVEDAVDELQACTDPPPAEIKLTVYPDADHEAWTRTYDGSAGHDIYEWLLDQRLGG